MILILHFNVRNCSWVCTLMACPAAWMRLLVCKTILLMTHLYYLIIAAYPRQISFVGNGSIIIDYRSARECEISTVDSTTTPEHIISLKSSTTALQDRVILFHSTIPSAVFATAIIPQSGMMAPTVLASTQAGAHGEYPCLVHCAAHLASKKPQRW